MRRWIFLYSDSGSQPPATGCGIILGIPLVMGLLYLIVSGEAKVADSAMQLSLALNAGVVLWLVIQLFLGRLHFSVDIKRFLRGLGIGLIVYIGITAVLILMG
ncbi:MAG: hypothetical protein IJY28_00310, partial [Clostridia bacterium]|nr:hypothetical protein [Clostridia bacterium]